MRKNTKFLNNLIKSCFSFKDNKDVSGMILNEKQIKQKLVNYEKSKSLKIENYEIKKQGEFYDTKNKNPTLGVFDFEDEILQPKQEQKINTFRVIQVYGLGNGYFSVNDVWYPGSIIVLPNQVFLWDVETGSDILAHTLDLIDVIKPQPNYIILGTGKDKVQIEESVYQRFKDRNIQVDVIPTFEACSTFNVCNEDGMNVIAFLIPANL